ncbi:MAG: hypothetical protein COX46_05380 [bacterium (Candidatus Ratteibacteria) CG23_combo_of_CG06-09_8_20_14_all_48_7]|uniref:Xylose isomerase-like TIM barrel domain-containing protein n=1 Tax=bacterium (Candidatus Ratteibacteria) CG23_combo_of_CG06-09_8_20_14_all_48_7 TaxID=2014292 RepID=A0A2G9Y8R6_9BACT|nr:MAG: hypothetical protein COX46_05380 [bacterium (Candidatus Ratteibacteria) CG23_combo_of_CG06-09_8_20_14_all_48_7]
MIIGATSWVQPGTYYENARILEDVVDLVELLFYTWDKETEGVISNEMQYLRELELKYTVHLPVDNVGNCQRVYSFFKDAEFPVRNFTLHPIPEWEGFIAGKEDVSLENLVSTYPRYPRMTLDIGHAILTGLEPDYFLGAEVEIKEVHLSGVKAEADHQEIVDDKELKYLKIFSRDGLMVILEIFNLKSLMVSKRRVEEWQNRWMKGY